MKKPIHQTIAPMPDEISRMKSQLKYLIEPDFTRDCWIRLDGRMNSTKLAELATKLLGLLECDYPEPKKPSYCTHCGRELCHHG